MFAKQVSYNKKCGSYKKNQCTSSDFLLAQNTLKTFTVLYALWPSKIDLALKLKKNNYSIFLNVFKKEKYTLCTVL